ncbi:unnamed protein product [Ectocarpus sp. CCAP 1310/34]|nr:unnamed protein product [Ectocarpus sp. CCAP 1310/34]
MVIAVKAQGGRKSLGKTKPEGAPKAKSASPQTVSELAQAADVMEGKRLEDAQKEAEKEWQELEAANTEVEEGGGGCGDGGEGENKVPALLQMAANQVQQDETLTEEERRKQAGMLLARADSVTDQDSNASAKQSNTATATNGKSDSEERSSAAEKEASSPAGRGPAAENGENSGGGARQAQLASLLCKAEQYSMFIRQSQMDVEASRPIAPTKQEDERGEKDDAAAEQEGEDEGAGSGRGRGGNKRSPGKRSPSSRGKKGKSSSGRAFSSAATKMKKAKEEAAAREKDDGSFRQPSNLVGGTLKPYQLEGLRWLVTLYENGLSGILADEMGLGKTIQATLIAHLRSKGVNGPFLVTAPLATLPNWVKEFQKWLPAVDVILYHGSKDHRSELRRTVMKPRLARSSCFPVVVTSYEVSIIDRAALQGYCWQYLIIDEGQRIKNASCRLVQELKKLPSENRLLLSGTPIQNTLEELWSLLNFVNPHIFDDLSIFRSWFGFKNIGKETSVESIVDEQQHSKIVSKLHEILRPFLIRRIKKDVLANDGLPPKREVVVYAGMTSWQRGYYDLVGRNALRQALMDMGIEGAARLSEININMNQRKVCQHPFLFGEPKDKMTGEYVGIKNPEILVRASGKVALMDRMLKKLHAGGHKVLIFSQMTSLLDVLEDYLRHRGWEFHRIDGSTDVLDRQSQIEEFNSNPKFFVFLLSTRAGGLGINLCAADTCILFDSDWNPHQDSQAMARCHRIGQQKPVMVYRLLTTGSVEIEMMAKQISKKKLERVAVQGGDFGKAGKRTYGEMTVPHLRKLLEDDVEDLAKRALCPEAGDGVDRSITEEELDGILDRERVFASATGWGDSSLLGGARWGKREDGAGGAGWGERTGGPVVPLPREGEMYDVVDELDASVLSSME